MTIIQSIILGIVQGITEFLPISSSGHLIILPKFFDWTLQSLAYDAIIHLATGVAIIIALWPQIVKLVKSLNFSRQESEIQSSRKLLGLIVLAIIPAGIIGLLFDQLIEDKFRMMEIVAWSLIFWAVILLLAEEYSYKLVKRLNLDQIGWRQSLAVGFLQVIALIPGTSRSGITIIGGLFSGMDKKTAVHFSFLVGLPLIMGAGLYKFFELYKMSGLEGQGIVLLAGFVSALVCGLVAIKLLVWMAERFNFKIFVVYRIILGIIILLFV